VNALHRPPPPVRLPLVISLAVVLVLVLATLGGFATHFGVMQSCTDTYRCTVTRCRPCATTATWLDAGWAVQGVLLLVGVVLTVLAMSGVRPRTVRLAAWLLGPASIALMIATTVLAAHSY
jgi:hypothetical protein